MRHSFSGVWERRRGNIMEMPRERHANGVAEMRRFTPMQKLVNQLNREFGSDKFPFNPAD